MSGTNSPPPSTFPVAKPGFGDLDENQDYFPYDNYSDEVKDPEDKIPAVTTLPVTRHPTGQTSSNGVTINSDVAFLGNENA